MKTNLSAALLCVSACMTGCASIVSGTNQPIALETRLNGEALPNASCKLTNNKGSWFVTTPGSVVVHRSFQDLNIECAKVGIQPGIAIVHSSTKAMAFGNILFGGVIGAGVDIGTGAAYDYPSPISVEMASTAANSSPQAKPVATVSSTSPPTPTQVPQVALVAAAAPATAIAMPASIEQPSASALAASSSSREMKYQISAEQFAKSQQCSAQPQAILGAASPGSETYTIACNNGEALIARCEYGICHALQ